MVIELKTIEKDYFKEGGFIDKLNSIVIPQHKAFRHLPLLPGYYKIKVPDKNREGTLDTIEEPLRKVLKKANRQIRETKKALLSNTGYGIVVVALNMDTGLDINIFYGLIAELLSREFSSIDGIILCDINLMLQRSDLSAIHAVKITLPENLHNRCSEMADWIVQYFSQPISW